VKGLYAAKPWFTRQLGRIVDVAVARRWSPDAFTIVGILFALLAAAGLLWNSWPVVLLGLVGRLAGANLDGAVARARHVSRPFGFVLNEIGDRLSDLLPLAALALLAARSGSPVALTLALVAITAAGLPTFVSLAIAGAGGPRLNGGPFGKTERTLTVFACAVALAVTSHVAVLIVTSVVLLVGSLLTATTRTLSGRKLLATRR